MTCREQGQFGRAVCGRGPVVTSCGGRIFVAVSDATGRVDWSRRCFGRLLQYGH